MKKHTIKLTAAELSVVSYVISEVASKMQRKKGEKYYEDCGDVVISMSGHELRALKRALKKI